MQTPGHKKTSVIIDNFYFVRMAIVPSKADAPLIVNANAVLPGAIAFQSFQAISRWRSHLLQTPSGIQLLQLSESNSCDRPELAMITQLEQLPCGGVSVSTNHC